MKLSFALLCLLATLGAGCCLQEINLRPELDAVDLAKARAGSASLAVSWKFKECCPTSDQRAVALRLQSRVAALFDEVIAGKIELARYNELVRAANGAIKNVVLVCVAAGKKIASTDPALHGLGTAAAVDRAWQRCSALADELGKR